MGADGGFRECLAAAAGGLGGTTNCGVEGVVGGGGVEMDSGILPAVSKAPG